MTLNRYAYAKNSLLNYIDPSGNYAARKTEYVNNDYTNAILSIMYFNQKETGNIFNASFDSNKKQITAFDDEVSKFFGYGTGKDYEIGIGRIERPCVSRYVDNSFNVDIIGGNSGVDILAGEGKDGEVGLKNGFSRNGLFRWSGS